MKTILLATVARGLFAMPAMNYFGAVQVAYEAPNDQGIKAMAEEIKAEHKKAISAAVDPIRELAEKAIAMAEKGEKLSGTIKGDADEALIKMNKRVDEITTEFEQKMAKIGTGTDEQGKSIGEQFIELEELKAFSASPRNGSAVNLSVKADITTATADAAGSAGAGITPNRLPGILALPQRRMTVRNLLSPGRTDGPLIQYLQETGFTNAAAPVAEGALKPQSDLKLTDKDVSTKVIAHWMRASKQILSDFSQIRSLIDERLLYGLDLKEEDQLLNGDGTGENLLGIIPQATAYSSSVPIPDMTMLDVMRLAMLQAALAEYPATGHVLNPIDWTTIELSKDADGRYIIGNPQGTTSPTLWGLPVVSTQAMVQDKFLTGAFRLGAQVFDQWDSRVEAGFQNDDFVRNKVTFLAEERLALALYRPEAFIYGDFSDALAA